MSNGHSVNNRPSLAQNTLSAVFNSQPPKRVPLGCIMGAVMVLPEMLEDAHAPPLVTINSACRRRRKSAAGPNWFRRC